MGHLIASQKMGLFWKKMINFQVVWYSNLWMYILLLHPYIGFRLLESIFLCFWGTEKDEVRDAVLVTDGDNDIGQVCYATNSQVHALCIFVANV